MKRPRRLGVPIDDATNWGGLEAASERRPEHRQKTARGALILLVLSLAGCGVPRQDELWPTNGVVSNQALSLQKAIQGGGAQPPGGQPGQAPNAPAAPTIRCMPTLGAVDCYQDEPAPPPAAPAITAPLPPSAAVTPPEAPASGAPLSAPTPLTPIN
jgi:hypothetical protein